MKKLTKRDIKRLAKHEGGHAVHHAVALGYPFEFVWIRRSADEKPPQFNGRTQVADDIGGGTFSHAEEIWETTHDLVGNYMAGLAGERIDRKRPGKFDFVAILTGCESDWRAALECIRDHNERRLGKFLIGNNDTYMDECFAAAWNRLQVHKAAHAEVTRLLIERGTLTYKEVHGIVWKKAHEKAGQQ